MKRPTINTDERKEYTGLFPMSPDYEWRTIKIAAVGQRPRGGLRGIWGAIVCAITGRKPPLLPVEIEFSSYVRADRPLLVQINGLLARGTVEPGIERTAEAPDDWDNRKGGS